MSNQMMPNQMMQTQQLMQNAFMSFLGNMGNMARQPTTPMTVFAPRRRESLAINDAEHVGSAKPPEHVHEPADDPSKVITPERPVATGSNQLFQLPSITGTLSDQTAKPHGWDAATQAEVMKEALSSKKASKKAEKDATANAPATKSVTKAAPKTKGKAKKVLKDGRPMYPKQQGGGAIHYNGGKVLRSDTFSCWRVFIQSTDRCDKRVPWNGNISKSWQQALDMIDHS